MVTPQNDDIIRALAGTVAEARNVLGDAIQAVAQTGCFLIFDGDGSTSVLTRAPCMITPLPVLPPRSRPVSLREARATFSELCREAPRRPVVLTYGLHGPHALLSAFPGNIQVEPTFGPGLNLIVAGHGDGKSVLALRGMVAASDQDERRDIAFFDPGGHTDIRPLMERRWSRGFQALSLPERPGEPTARFLIRADSRRTLLAHGNLLRSGVSPSTQAGLVHVLSGLLDDVERLSEPLIVVEHAAIHGLHGDPRPVSDLLLRLADHAQVVVIEEEIPDRPEWRPLVEATQTLFYRSTAPPFWPVAGSGSDAARGSPSAAPSHPAGLGQVLLPFAFLRQDRKGGLTLIPGLRTGRIEVRQHWLSHLLRRPSPR